MAIKIIYFVHGTTYDNSEGLSSGWNDVQLTEKGIEQSIKLGEEKNDTKIDVIFSYDLSRAVKSAELAIPNHERIQDSRLRECNYGSYNGKNKELVVYEDHIDEPFPNGESLKDVEKRIRDFINDLRNNKEYEGKVIGIIAHRAPQLAFEVITKKISWEEANKNDWRKTKKWQPGWEYIVE